MQNTYPQGRTLFVLSLSVIIHPSLLTRIVLTAVMIPILTVMTLLPLDRFQHSALRFATSSTGAAGLVVSIALLAGIPPWANVWERYWVQDGLDWGTSQEKGLSAAFFLLLSTGIVCDWFLKRTFGECPDEVTSLSYYVPPVTKVLPRNGTVTSPTTPPIFLTVQELMNHLYHSGSEYYKVLKPIAHLGTSCSLRATTISNYLHIPVVLRWMMMMKVPFAVPPLS